MVTGFVSLVRAGSGGPDATMWILLIPLDYTVQGWIIQQVKIMVREGGCGVGELESSGFESRNVTATEGVIGGKRDPQNWVSLCCGIVNAVVISLFSMLLPRTNPVVYKLRRHQQMCSSFWVHRYHSDFQRVHEILAMLPTEGNGSFCFPWAPVLVAHF